MAGMMVRFKGQMQNRRALPSAHGPFFNSIVRRRALHHTWSTSAAQSANSVRAANGCLGEAIGETRAVVCMASVKGCDPKMATIFRMGNCSLDNSCMGADLIA